MITLVKGRRTMGTSGHGAYGNRHLDESRRTESEELFTKRQSSSPDFGMPPKEVLTSNQGGGSLGSHVKRTMTLQSQKEGATVGGWQRVQLHLLARGGGSGIHKAQSLFLVCCGFRSPSTRNYPFSSLCMIFVLLSSCRRSYLAGQRVRVEIAPYRSRPFALSHCQLHLAAAPTVCAS